MTIHTYPWKTTDARDLLDQRDRLLVALENMTERGCRLINYGNALELLEAGKGFMAIPHEVVIAEARALIAECRAAEGTEDAEREATTTGGPLEPGITVMIYEDPITRKKEEGRATLVEKRHENPGMEFWSVRFQSDYCTGYDDATYERWVYTGANVEDQTPAEREALEDDLHGRTL